MRETNLHLRLQRHHQRWQLVVVSHQQVLLRQLHASEGGGLRDLPSLIHHTPVKGSEFQQQPTSGCGQYSSTQNAVPCHTTGVLPLVEVGL